MTFGFALVLTGFLLLDAGWKGKTPVGVLKGVTEGAPKGAGGVLAETGRDVLATFSGGGGGNTPPVNKSKSTPQSNALKKINGTVNMDGHPVAKWIAVELQWAREHGWTGTVTSGYRTPAEGRYLYEHPEGYPVAKPGTSNHEKKKYPGGAVDVTQPEQLNQVLSKKPDRLLHYTGKTIGDTPHFSSGLDGV